MSLESIDKTKPTGLEDYLSFLYGEQEGYVYSPTKEYIDGEPPKWEQHFYQWPNQKANLIQHIIEEAPEKEIYIGPALYSTNSSRADKSNVLGSNVVWTDFDGHIPEALDGIPDPSLRINSSDTGHEHWYWKLDDFIINSIEIEDINRALAYKLDADTGGWDITQVLRPPKTFNHGRNRKVEVISYNKWVFNKDRFATIPKPPVPVNNYHEDDLLDTGEIIAKYQWPLEAFRLFRRKDVPTGERSTKLMQLGYYCAEIGLKDREIFSILYGADQWWGKFKDRDDKDKRLNDIVSKARLKHPLTNNSFHIRELPIYGVREVLNAEVKLEWAAEGLLESMGCGLLSAKPGVGKTQVSLQLAIHLALGVPWLRYNITEARKILFFSLEMHLPGVQFFLNKMTSKMNEETVTQLQENLKIVPLGQAIEVMSPNNDRLIKDKIEEYEVQGLFFDSLGRTNQKDLSKDDHIRPLFDWDAGLRNQYKMFTWYVHHNRKATQGNSKPKSLDDVFGNIYITASCSDVYTLWGADSLNKTIEFINVKHRYSEQEKPYLIERTSTLNFSEQSDIKVLVEENNHDTGLIRAHEIDNDRDLKEGPRIGGEAGLDF